MTFKLPVRRRDLPYFWFTRFKAEHPIAYLCLGVGARMIGRLGLPLAAIIGGCLIMSGRIQDPMPPAVQHGLIYILLAAYVLQFRLRRDGSDD